MNEPYHMTTVSPFDTIGNEPFDAIANGHVPDEPESLAVERRAAADALTSPDDAPVIDPSFQPIDLAPVLAGSYRQPQPTMTRRDDSLGLFYVAAVNGLHGDSGVGKGWIVCHAIADAVRTGGTALYIDLEDNEQSITSRLRAVGLTDEQIVTRVLYVRPQAPFGMLAVAHLVDLITTRKVTLAIIDSLGEAFGLAGINEDKDAEVGPWMRLVARPLADTGACVLLVDHSTKAGDNPLHPSGSKRKRAAITGASFLVEAIQPLVKGAGGRLRLTCAKDRHGNYKRSAVAADAVMATSTTDSVRITLHAPSQQQTESSTPKKVEQAARAAVAVAKKEGVPLSQNTLVAAMDVKASTDTKRGGLDLAVARGALIETPGTRGARLFEYATDLPEQI